MKPRWRWKPAELKAELVRYGPIGLVTWFAVFGIFLIGFYSVLALGVQIPWVPASVATAGTWAAAYAVTKVLMPVRIAIVLALTPLLARLLGRSPPPSPA